MGYVKNDYNMNRELLVPEWRKCSSHAFLFIRRTAVNRFSFHFVHLTCYLKKCSMFFHKARTNEICSVCTHLHDSKSIIITFHSVFYIFYFHSFRYVYLPSCHHSCCYEPLKRLQDNGRGDESVNGKWIEWKNGEKNILTTHLKINFYYKKKVVHLGIQLVLSTSFNKFRMLHVCVREDTMQCNAECSVNEYYKPGLLLMDVSVTNVGCTTVCVSCSEQSWHDSWTQIMHLNILLNQLSSYHKLIGALMIMAHLWTESILEQTIYKILIE